MLASWHCARPCRCQSLSWLIFISNTPYEIIDCVLSQNFYLRVRNITKGFKNRQHSRDDWWPLSRQAGFYLSSTWGPVSGVVRLGLSTAFACCARGVGYHHGILAGVISSLRCTSATTSSSALSSQDLWQWDPNYREDDIITLSICLLVTQLTLHL